LQCETAVAGVPGGPYGKITMQKTGVKKAEKALRLFYFGKNKMRFFRIILTFSLTDICGAGFYWFLQHLIHFS